MAEHSLSEPFEVTGDWFLPENAQRQIGGTLVYKPERTELKLNDRLHPFQGKVALKIGGPIQKYPVIHGVTTKGEAVTLFDAWQDGYQINASSGGVRMPEIVTANLVIFGSCITAEDKYPEMRFGVPGLEAWLSNKSIRVLREERGFSLSVGTLSDEVTPFIDGDLKWGSDSLASIGSHAASIKTHGYVDLIAREARPLSWYLDELPKITSLLTLLAGHQMPVDKMTLPIEPKGRRLSVLMTMFGNVKCPFTNEHEFFLTRPALGDNFTQLVDKWFSLYPKVQSACSLAIGVMTSNQLWPNVEFLSLMQSLEGLHRALYDGTYVTPSAYKAVRELLTKAIPSGVSQAHRNALKSKIRYGNELSLRSRIRGLLDELPLTLREHIVGNDGTKVLGAWIDTRNYYTHWDEALRLNILEMEEMYYASVRLKELLRTLYLHFTGVSEDRLLKAFNNNSSVSRLLRQINVGGQGRAQ